MNTSHPHRAMTATFLLFDGKAEEAVNLYVSLVPGSSITSIERYGPGEPGKEGSVKLVRFELNGSSFMAIDSPVPHEFSFTPAISIYVSCATEDELNALYGALSEGGEVFMPLDSYPFSKRFAWIADRFGVSWQFAVES